MTRDDVAPELGISARTVELHVDLRRAKTGRVSALAAVVDLVRLGLI